MSPGLRNERIEMPRYLVELTFPEGLRIPVENRGAELCRGVVERNTENGVTGLPGVNEDKTRIFCIYDASTPEAMRKTLLASCRSTRSHM
jgi:hypothetical protein